MIALDFIYRLIEAHPFLVVFPLAIFEGPIVTVLAAWLLRGSLWDLSAVFLICVAADLVGDAGLYWLGRKAHALNPRWRKRLGLREERLSKLVAHFDSHGGKTLTLGKLTHSVGFAVLLAAGASRMAFAPFMGWNLLATLPKTLFFILIGYSFGAAYSAVDSWIFRASVIILALAALGAAAWVLHRRRTTTP